MAYNPAGRPGAGMAIPAVVGEGYTVPYVAQFEIEQKVMTVSGGKFSIRDAQGTLLFDVKGKNPLALHTRRVLRDAAGQSLVLLKKKVATMHDRWSAYRGEDDSDNNLLFTMSKTSVFNLAPSFDIFLASNQSSRPDFTVKGDFFEHNYAILFNNIPIAETRKKINMSSLFIGKDQYAVTIYPGVDHAFIASIIIIVDQVKQDDAQGGSEILV